MRPADAAPTILAPLARLAVTAIFLVLGMAPVAAASNPGDRFGSVLAADGDTLVVGVPGYQIDVNGELTAVGAVYVFVHADGQWVQQGFLRPPPAFGFASGFGKAVAIDGDTILVGHPDVSAPAGEVQGAAHVFERAAGAWAHAQVLSGGPSDNAFGGGDFFGAAVALDGDTAAIGAPLDDVGSIGAAGRVYIFARGGGVWTRVERLEAASPVANEGVGRSVALSNRTVLAGRSAAPGRVRAWFRVSTEVGWVLQATLFAADQTLFDDFGGSLALDGDIALVGAPLQPASPTISERGAAYVFRRSGAAWSLETKLLPPDGPQPTEFAKQFGYVALRNDRALVGAPNSSVEGILFRGRAYLFERDAGAWPLRSIMTPGVQLAPGDSLRQFTFGSSVALAPGFLAIGSPTASVQEVNDARGAVQTCIGTPPALGATLDSDSGLQQPPDLGFKDGFEPC